MEYNYKFCILAAGKGTRMKNILELHKALLPLENKAVISHIINKVPKEVEIVIAVGYKSEQIKTYLNNIYENRKITYVDVNKYEGLGSGPGYSLLQCEKELQCPFIYTAADTIIDVDYTFTTVNENWIGIAEISEEYSNYYCLVKGEKELEKFYYGTGTKAYIGIAGIYQYKNFWESLKDDILIFNEKQVLNGFKTLTHVKYKYFDWYDTGNEVAFKRTKQKYNKNIVAPKKNECLFIENKKVIKYFDDEKIIDDRIKRLNYLNNTTPGIKKLNPNMYSYNLIDGITLSLIYDENKLQKSLNFWYDKLGSKQFKTNKEFFKNCELMYKEKTYKRCEPFIGTELDNIEYINGIKVEKIINLLEQIDWKFIHNKSIPSNFHGDFQPENIICTLDNFYLIDWRERFGNNLEIGDMYYDLGKLYHALLINGIDINNKLYSVEIRDFSAYISHHSRNNLLVMLKKLKQFCLDNNYSWKKVKIIGILQYLNIANLYNDYHKGEYRKFLFLYGKYLLTKFINNEQ